MYFLDEVCGTFLFSACSIVVASPRVRLDAILKSCVLNKS